MIVRIAYHPSAPQRLFHETTADEIGYGGELGGGKTKALTMDVMLAALKYPGSTTYVFRATYQQGEDTLLEEMERSYPKELANYIKQNTTWNWINGSKTKMRQCNSLADAKKNDGKEFNKLYVDEVQHLPFDAFDYLCTRPRANKALGMQPQVKFTAMEGGKGHAWLKRTYIDKLDPNIPKLTVVKDEKTGEEYEIFRQFIPASLEDNKHIDDNYAGRLNMRSSRIRKKARSNNWQSVDGAAFPEWKNQPIDPKTKKPTDKWTHVIEPFPIPAHWPIIRGYDHGRAKPYSVLWFAQSDEMYNNRLFLIDELYGGTDDEEGLDETVSQIAVKIARKEKPLVEKHEYIEGIADPAIFGKNYFDDETVASVFATAVYDENGAMIRPPIDFRDPRSDPEVAYNVVNNRMQGIELFHEALMFDASGIPGLQAFSTCKKFIQHIPELVKDEKNPDDVASVGTADHDYDACRLVVKVKRPMAFKPVEAPKKYKPDPLDMARKDDYGEDARYGTVLRIPDIIVG